MTFDFPDVLKKFIHYILYNINIYIRILSYDISYFQLFQKYSLIQLEYNEYL